MKEYILNEIYSDGYERYAIIEEIEKNIKINVHFLEYNEYLENGEKVEKKKKGDTIKGEISIELVAYSQKVNGALDYHQEIYESSHIKAIVEVVQIIDAFSVYALSSIFDDHVVIEFENTVNYAVGDRVLVIGSLELKEE